MEAFFIYNNYFYSVMSKKWEYSEFENVSDLQLLMTDLGVSKTIAKLLINRGINTYDSAKEFFRPSIDKLHDPFLMKGMTNAIDRIQDAIGNNEKILIYGDYDVDGTTSVALVFQYLRSFTSNLEYYIPDRYKEGYGVSNIGVDYAIKNDFSLIIALDCGVKAVEKVKRAKESKVDFIICDHHTPGEILPNAIILNPKQKDCSYPFKELCGCGVGFKLVQGLNDTFALPFSEIEYLLDLVMVAIGADMVSVMGENRIMAYHGLKKLNKNPRIGFSVLLELAGKKAPLTVTDVVFNIAPRINAAGRIDSGNKAVELLLATSIQDAESIGKEINNYNLERRRIESEITEEALKMIEADEFYKDSFSTVIFNKNWHKGVIGIVASRIIEKYYKPTIVLTESNGNAVGSVRSIKGLDVYNVLTKCSHLLEQFGGHKFAAGLTMKIANIGEFRHLFNDLVKKELRKQDLVELVEIEEEILLSDIFQNNKLNQIPKFYRILKQFAPFGPDNMKPIFISKNVHAKSKPKLLKDAHLKMSVFQFPNEDTIVECIGFNLKRHFELVRNNSFDLAYHIEENRWLDRIQLQLIIKDIK